MDLTPPGYKHGDGLFVVGKTRCVLIVDTDGDDKADKEIDVAGGWKESFHNVDGLGVAFDPKDGSVYFGRGTYNFADPLLDGQGRQGRSTRSRTSRGTIIRVSPDFKTREIVATGIRFPVGLRFNRARRPVLHRPGRRDLGAQRQPVRRAAAHPEGPALRLPAAAPEAPAERDRRAEHVRLRPAASIDVRLQLQRAGEGGRADRSARSDWAGDAIVTGDSRGKLYRTQLVKTPRGLRRADAICSPASSMLTVDACVAPDGGLVVACHSGGPDWGSGPTGKGKLFKITLHRPRASAAGARLAGRAARGARRVRPAGRPGAAARRARQSRS